MNTYCNMYIDVYISNHINEDTYLENLNSIMYHLNSITKIFPTHTEKKICFWNVSKKISKAPLGPILFDFFFNFLCALWVTDDFWFLRKFYNLVSFFNFSNFSKFFWVPYLKKRWFARIDILGVIHTISELYNDVSPVAVVTRSKLKF